MSEEIKAVFESLTDQLLTIQNQYYPNGDNLYFDGLTSVDIKLFYELRRISRQGIKIVESDDQRYSNKTAYAYSMHDYWYTYFLLVSKSSQRVLDSSQQHDIPIEVITDIVDDLIFISGFSTIVLGDIYSRNLEALANTLIAFQGVEMLKHVEQQRQRIDCKKISHFLDNTLKVISTARNHNREA